MDASVVNYLLSGALGIIMFFFKRTIDTLENKQTALEVALQVIRETRVHKDDFKEFKQELREQFEEVKQAIRDVKFTNNG